MFKRRSRSTSVCPSSPAEKLTFAEKFSRLATRLQDPEWRRYGMVILAGKAMGIALVLSLLLGPTLIRVASDFWAPVVHAQTAPDPYKTAVAADLINPINTGWVLLGAFLVFGMQAGFTMLEAGFCRNRETVNVLVECMFDTCVCGLLH